MLSRHAIDQYAPDSGKSYQPTISHCPSHYAGCFLLGTSKVSGHDLDTIANTTQHASLDSRAAIIELMVATSAPATGVRTQQPAARAAAALSDPTAATRLEAFPPRLARQHRLPGIFLDRPRVTCAGQACATRGLPGVWSGRPFRLADGASLPRLPAGATWSAFSCPRRGHSAEPHMMGVG